MKYIAARYGKNRFFRRNDHRFEAVTEYVRCGSDAITGIIVCDVSRDSVANVDKLVSSKYYLLAHLDKYFRCISVFGCQLAKLADS